MSRPARILICGVQVPFARGGAEALVDSLGVELRGRGHEVDTVLLPFAWEPRQRIFDSALAWRLLDLRSVEGRPVDLVVTTRFPSYLVRHPNKVVWLVHQFRQVYDLLGTPYSDFGRRSGDGEAIELIHEMDRRGLGEARRRYAISRNTARRLAAGSGLDAAVLYPPSPIASRLHSGPHGNFVLSVGRLDPLKRVDLLIEALAAVPPPLEVFIAGDGPERPALEQRARALGVGERVHFLGRVDEERLIDLYATARAVYYAPFDEDYGYVTLEAMAAGRPVVTTADAGGVLEFVRDGENGLVAAAASPTAVAVQLGRVAGDAALVQRLGAGGRTTVAPITWGPVLDSLTETL